MDVFSILRHSLQTTDGVNPIAKHFRLLRQSGSSGQEMIWKIYDAVRIQDGLEASVFLFEKRIADKLHKPRRREIVTEILRREVALQARLRHPSILRVYHGLEECTDSLAFATEPVLASLANLLGNYDRLPGTAVQDLKDHCFVDVEYKCGILQVAEGIFYLHVTEQMMHLNLCPQSIFVTRRGIWKIGGLGFAKTIADSDFKPWMSKNSKMAQPDLDYAAPEIQLETTATTASTPSATTTATTARRGQCSPASDVFSLGLLICSVHSAGRSLIQAANNTAIYAKQLDRMNESFGEIASKIPAPLVDQLQRMINKDAANRPSIQAFIMMKYFDDAVVHCMQTMNALEFQDFGQKREFFTILSQTIPLFPRKLLYNSVFPMLRDQTDNPETFVLALPCLLHIIEISTDEDYKNIVQPHFKHIMTMSRPVQATVYLLEKMDILLSKATEEDIKTDLLPLVFNTLASNSIQGQEAALNVFSTIRKYVDDDSLRHLVLPRAKNLFSKSTNVRTRQVALECMDRLLESLDKMMILDEVLPFITEIQCSDVDIIMSVVAIYKHLLSDKRFGLTHNLLATKVMPTLIPQTVCPGLSISQFTSLMEVLHTMMDNIEMERLKKMANEMPDQDCLDHHRRKSLEMRCRQMADCTSGNNFSYGSLGEKTFLNVDEKYFSKYRPPSTPELMINSSQDSLGPKTYRRHSSFQSLGLAEQAVLESIIRQRRSTLISPHLRLSGSVNPHIYVSQASISDFKPTMTSRRRSSTVSTGPILIPDVGRRDSYGRLITRGYSPTRRSSFQGICETAMQFFGAK